MIIEKVNLKDNLVLEIVDKKHIQDSYRNRQVVSSCMSKKGRWKYTKLYNYIKDLKLLRIMDQDTLVLRTLLWTVTDGETNFKFLDKVYRCHTDYCCIDCDGYYAKDPHPTAYEQFKEIWPKFADVRNTAKQVFATLYPNRVKIWPYMDTFCFVNEEKTLLSNQYDDSLMEYEDICINALDHTNYYD